MKNKIYEEVSVICKTGWDKTGELVDKESGYGVACVLAYISGVRPDLNSLAEHIGCDKADIERPFRRLFQSGVFSKSFNARGDAALFYKKTECEWHTAWCTLAGIASGIIERNYNK